MRRMSGCHVTVVPNDVSLWKIFIPYNVKEFRLQQLKHGAGGVDDECHV